MRLTHLKSNFYLVLCHLIFTTLNSLFTFTCWHVAQSHATLWTSLSVFIFNIWHVVTSCLHHQSMDKLHSFFFFIHIMHTFIHCSFCRHLTSGGLFFNTKKIGFGLTLQAYLLEHVLFFHHDSDFTAACSWLKPQQWVSVHVFVSALYSQQIWNHREDQYGGCSWWHQGLLPC